MADPLTALVFDSLIPHGLVILVIVFVLEGLVIGKLLPREAVLVAAILLFSHLSPEIDPTVASEISIAHASVIIVAFASTRPVVVATLVYVFV
ncbi:hypothetical protein HAPAU_30230 [Halalkalicoccus paucihalophilus]|uniref:Uncharacterized protein n=1 Tax=Halalkalicoccus paucihalophilus TaxID=1008153 RepID=A0A151AB72_9EURY|nr:hypothetical protein [Halalkalicoccus paucihalophilus]KYH24931.1 hypothetical protein HAPAU_30230 [Halalkalicoccus paucihalophilus]